MVYGVWKNLAFSYLIVTKHARYSFLWTQGLGMEVIKSTTKLVLLYFLGDKSPWSLDVKMICTLHSYFQCISFFFLLFPSRGQKKMENKDKQTKGGGWSRSHSFFLWTLVSAYMCQSWWKAPGMQRSINVTQSLTLRGSESEGICYGFGQWQRMVDVSWVILSMWLLSASPMMDAVMGYEDAHTLCLPTCTSFYMPLPRLPCAHHPIFYVLCFWSVGQAIHHCPYIYTLWSLFSLHTVDG